MKASLTLFLMSFLMMKKSYFSIPCSSINPVHCECFVAELLEPEEGVHISCPDNRSYLIEYTINDLIKLECLTPQPPYAPALFKNMNTTEIVRFEFTRCPPPNISFNEILEGYTVNSLTFISNKNGIKSENFEGLNDLVTLILQRNYIPFLSKDLFQNVKQLQVLRLNDNRIQKLDEESFNYLFNLTHLEIGGNPIRFLPENVFSKLYKLEVLHLYKIQLKNLSKDIFKDLSALKILDISSNNLEKLPDSIFDSLLNVEQINLKRNKLKSLPENLFRSTMKLKILDFGRNSELDLLPETLLFGLKKLENIAMESCNISYIPELFFSQAKELKIIKINNNRIYSLSDVLFQNNSNLQTLFMSYNYLTTLPSAIFKRLYNLETLGISKNNLQHLPRNIFWDLIRLKTINLSYNNITHLEQDMFKNMQSLETFDISNNKLTKMYDFGVRNLKKINICKNELSEFPNFNWGIYLYLEDLNLQYNKITSLSIRSLLSQKTIIRLGWNNISYIDISELKNIRKVYKNFSTEKTPSLPAKWFFFPNPISCDCHIYPFVSFIRDVEVSTETVFLAKFADFDDLKCSQPERLNGNKLSKLGFNDFKCEITEDCPSYCNCSIIAKEKLLVNCSNRGLDKFPNFAPWNTSILDLSGNHLTSLDDLKEAIWENVTEVLLDNNNISVLKDWSFHKNLAKLYLNRNLLRVLPYGFMDYAATKPTFEITLGENPWQCNCETTNFKAWLTENYRRVKDINKVYCENQRDENGTMNVIRVPDDIICPPDNWPHKKQLITVTVIGVLLALLLFVILILYYRNRNTVIAYFYFHFNFVFFCLYNEDELDEDKLFDAFVSYSSNDRDIMMALLNELENKDPSFKLCIHERDWMPGNLISLNIVNSVQYSRRTILILTQDFLESVWFQVEFQTAYHQMLEDKVNRLIVIVKGDLPPKETLDKNLQVILSTKTYLVWGERWFWEKLRYAMPHKKKPLANTDHRIVLSTKTANPDLLKSVEDKMSSFIYLPDSRNVEMKCVKSDPKMIAPSQADSGIYSLESISTENIISESDDV
ncbi:protein toll-like [Centruroides sculpturatus]|uniref:protein toll-like n=1 Tax=Centruroides sculpturatus TaxID=218467 RepID=UPI000C6CBC85|nr:protein toll-like [Centruroides sculpturatus]